MPDLSISFILLQLWKKIVEQLLVNSTKLGFFFFSKLIKLCLFLKNFKPTAINPFRIFNKGASMILN